MRIATKKRRFGDEEEQQSSGQQSQGILCCADGCCLAGTMSDSSKGGPFHCWAHDRLQEAGQWPLLTVGIKENRWLFLVADRVMTLPSHELEGKNAEINFYLSERGREDLARLKNDGSWSDRLAYEPRSAWVGRLRNAAYAAAFETVRAHWRFAA